MATSEPPDAGLGCSCVVPFLAPAVVPPFTDSSTTGGVELKHTHTHDKEALANVFCECVAR